MSREAVASNEQLGNSGARDDAQVHDVQNTMDRVTPSSPPPPQADEAKKR